MLIAPSHHIRTVLGGSSANRKLGTPTRNATRCPTTLSFPLRTGYGQRLALSSHPLSRAAERRSPHSDWPMSDCHCRLRRLLTTAELLRAMPLLPFRAGTAQVLSVSRPRKCFSCKHGGYF